MLQYIIGDLGVSLTLHVGGYLEIASSVEVSFYHLKQQTGGLESLALFIRVHLA